MIILVRAVIMLSLRASQVLRWPLLVALLPLCHLAQDPQPPHHPSPLQGAACQEPCSPPPHQGLIRSLKRQHWLRAGGELGAEEAAKEGRRWLQTETWAGPGVSPALGTPLSYPPPGPLCSKACAGASLAHTHVHALLSKLIL